MSAPINSDFVKAQQNLAILKQDIEKFNTDPNNHLFNKIQGEYEQLKNFNKNPNIPENLKQFLLNESSKLPSMNALSGANQSLISLHEEIEAYNKNPTPEGMKAIQNNLSNFRQFFNQSEIPSNDRKQLQQEYNFLPKIKRSSPLKTQTVSPLKGSLGSPLGDAAQALATAWFALKQNPGNWFSIYTNCESSLATAFNNANSNDGLAILCAELDLTTADDPNSLIARLNAAANDIGAAPWPPNPP